MKKILIHLMLATVAFAGPALAEESTIEGGWLSTVPYAGMAIQQSFVFEVSGDSLSGTLRLPYGSFPIEDGRIEGDSVSFAVTIENDGKEVRYQYAGKLIAESEVGLKNKEIHFVQTGGDSGELEYPALKAEMNMVGG
jgi:hypothetical protein